MTKKKQEQQKKSLRQAQRWYLVYYLRVFDGTSRNILGHVVDISEEGFKLFCDSPVQVGQQYQLRMCLPGQMRERDEVMFSATSRWCVNDATPGFFLAGFHLHNLRADVRQVVVDLIGEFSYNDRGYKFIDD